jgi:hypothetical protein
VKVGFQRKSSSKRDLKGKAELVPETKIKFVIIYNA